MLSLLVRCKYQQKKKSAGVKTGTGKRSAADDIKMGVVPVDSSGKRGSLETSWRFQSALLY